MSLTRLTCCLGLLILLSGVTAFSRQEGQKPELAEEPAVSIAKGGAGILDTHDYIVIYDQGRGKGTLFSKRTLVNDQPKRLEFTIK